MLRRMSGPVERKTAFYVCRHGTSEWNVLRLWQGTTNTNLAPEGIAQAQQKAAALTAAGLRFDLCICSDLRRAEHTAEIIAAAFPGLAIARDQRLRECGLGEFEGLHREVIHGPKYAHIFERLTAMAPEQRVHASYFDGLETPWQMSSRAMETFIDHAKQAPGSTVLVVTHSTIIESLLAVVFSKAYDGIAMSTLAHFRMDIDSEGRADLVEVHNITFSTGSVVK
eukprot:gnl/Spiro4/12341_TR6514_c0_g1_i1.p1 gnl/Spiro4/12341_TR6514_c0_g1~~gnl/Spiro4/12341_TR6514_c0_g1_i1.p1  ORF type:complete len:225 (+),score=51.31 gnl/Spiro4/12341_TR6514_c0_g1_i1:68-742(+)